MGRIIPIQINNFEGGMADDVRSVDFRKYGFSTRFVIHHRKGLVPKLDWVAATTIGASSTGLKAYSIQEFLYANNRIYGLGREGSSYPQIVEQTPISQTWSLSDTGSGTSNTLVRGSFSHYKNYLYGWSSGGAIFKYGSITTGTKVFTDVFATVSTPTNVAQAFVGKDDNVHFPYDNIVASYDNTTFTKIDLTLPDDMIIRSTDNWRKFAVVGCKSKSQIGGENSKVYLWDYVSDDITDVIDWGDGELEVIGTIEGHIIGVSIVRGVEIARKIVVKRYSGGEPKTIAELPGFDEDGDLINLENYKSVHDNKLFFTLSAVGNLNEMAGVWVVGRKSPNEEFAVYQNDRPNFTGGNALTIDGFINWRGFLFVAHQANGTVSLSANNTYTDKAIYESLKFNGKNAGIEKQLKGVRVTFKPLLSDGQVVLKYRVNEETSWTTIFTETKDDVMSKDATLEITNGKNFKTFKEIQFRIESTGKAEITGFDAKFEELDPKF